MQEYPHRYHASAHAGISDDIIVTSPRLPPLRTAAPAEFDGPGDRWSPETLLVASVANCFILTFRAIARAAKFSWVSLSCQVVGALDRLDRVTQFTAFVVRADLLVPDGADEEQARHLMAKAERVCLITNSLKATTTLDTTVRRAAQPERPAVWHRSA